MSARRSGRAKAPVKYTSDSEGSDFSTSRPKKSTGSKKKDAPTPRKAAKRPAKDDADTTTTTPTPKRRKKDADILAAGSKEKAQAQEEKAEKAAHKKTWDEWVADHDLAGKLLVEEPERGKSITQTDAQKKYSLKPAELGSLLHFEKKHPVYGNTTKLFVEDEVKVLGFRKYGILAGGSDEAKVLELGEKNWKDEHKSDPQPPSPKKAHKPTSRQTWTAYTTAHTLETPDSLTEEPDDVINQTESKSRYRLTPQDLVVLPYFPRKNPAYGNTVKLFKESEVKALAYRKAAVLGGVEEGDEVALLERGREEFEGKGEDGKGEDGKGE